MYIIMLGPPGCGKGTQADILSQSLKIPHISSGDLLRQTDNLSETLAQQIAEGAMLADEDVLGLVKDRLLQDDAKLGWVLDGFPRTLSQAEHLHKLLPDLEVVAISLVVSDENIKARLANRRTCPDCNAIYHLISNKPKVDGVCDACGGKLIVRPDDNPEVIANRLKVYRDKTAPLLEFYEKISHFLQIDCNEGKGPNEVFEMIKQELNITT